MESIDVALSKQIARKVRAKKKECWLNAWRGQSHLPGSFYVEGWIVDPDGLVIEHGWLETEDGLIVDPTLYHVTCVYFAGIRFDQEAALEAADKTRGELPIASNWSNFSVPSEGQRECYRQAYKSAFLHLGVTIPTLQEEVNRQKEQIAAQRAQSADSAATPEA